MRERLIACLNSLPPPTSPTLLLHFCRTVKHISEQCQVFNGKLMKVAAVLPDLASLSPLDYDTSKRADPEVLRCLMKDAKILRVREMVK